MKISQQINQHGFTILTQMHDDKRPVREDFKQEYLDAADKSCVILDYDNTYFNQFSVFTEECVKIMQNLEYRTVVLYAPSEAPSANLWTLILYILNPVAERVIIWDGSIEPLAIFPSLYGCNIKLKKCIHPKWFHLLHQLKNTKYEPVEKRDKHFLCLMRLPKYERVNLAVQLIQQGLHNDTIMSCGWGTDPNWHAENSDEMFNLIVPDDLRNLFPITLGHSDSEQHDVTSQMDRCYFNIVCETHAGISESESFLDDVKSRTKIYGYGNQRMFFTEKSAKAFLLMQAPLFLSKPGYVSVLRKIGFDLFDDLIDHSYDSEVSIDRRIELLVKEMKRLSEISLDDLEIYFQKNQNRFIKNYEQLNNVKLNYTKNFQRILNEFS